MSPINPRERGFTLIELMCVAFLFLLLAGFSSSLFRRSFDAMSEDGAARDMLNLMALARARAVMERMDYGVHLAPVEDRFWLVRREDGTGGDFSRIPGTWGSVHQLPRGVAYKGEETVVIFYSDGTATPADLQLSAHERTLALSVDPISGKGTLHEAS